MTNIKRTERGWPGHYICAPDCLFRRNTLLTNGKKHLIISTVGVPRRKDGIVETVRPHRYYETMCFVGKKDEHYMVIDVTREFYSYPNSLQWSINAKSAKELPDDVDNQANDMHESFVKWVTENFDFAYTEANKECVL